ncbi:MAG: peptidylprolyl isomerase [Peptostreptococcaceae bacterium]|nr:peptidylprolyl isomerase [Peptostreptococcaceae bacterium]
MITIEMENGKTIKAELFKDDAPITVANFVKLTKEGFYDGLIFHRIIPGFVAQGGDPKGDGTGGSKENIKGEFMQNGVGNPILHKKGVLSMARSANPNSASSQFFIVLDDAPHLNGGYAAFGQVIEGMEVVEEMAKVETNAMDKPLVEQKMKKVTVEEN